jgi:hypothetical protein
VIFLFRGKVGARLVFGEIGVVKCLGTLTAIYNIDQRQSIPREETNAEYDSSETTLQRGMPVQ